MIILSSSSTYGQFWPYLPMLRFGNTVYYHLNDDKPIKLHGTNILMDKGLNNRYFDVISKTDSLQLTINDAIYRFKQKSRREPRHNKDILFYSRRKLRNESATIKYLRLISINKTSIKAEATIKYKHQFLKKKEKIEINRDELKGLFIGAGKNLRTYYVVFHIVGITALLL